MLLKNGETREIEYIESSIVKDRIEAQEILLKIKVKIDEREMR